MTEKEKPEAIEESALEDVQGGFRENVQGGSIFVQGPAVQRKANDYIVMGTTTAARAQVPGDIDKEE